MRPGCASVLRGSCECLHSVFVVDEGFFVFRAPAIFPQALQSEFFFASASGLQPIKRSPKRREKWKDWYAEMFESVSF
jgi:hypothetical protein